MTRRSKGKKNKWSGLIDHVYVDKNYRLLLFKINNINIRYFRVMCDIYIYKKNNCFFRRLVC